MDVLVNAQSQAVPCASSAPCPIDGSDCPTLDCKLDCSCYPGRT